MALTTAIGRGRIGADGRSTPPSPPCGAGQLVFGHAAAVRGRAWAWPLAGLAVGLGILAKYTAVFVADRQSDCLLLTSRTSTGHCFSSFRFLDSDNCRRTVLLPILYWNMPAAGWRFATSDWQAGVGTNAMIGTGAQGAVFVGVRTSHVARLLVHCVGWRSTP